MTNIRPLIFTLEIEIEVQPEQINFTLPDKTIINGTEWITLPEDQQNKCTINTDDLAKIAQEDHDTIVKTSCTKVLTTNPYIRSEHDKKYKDNLVQGILF